MVLDLRGIFLILGWLHSLLLNQVAQKMRWLWIALLLPPTKHYLRLSPAAVPKPPISVKFTTGEHVNAGKGRSTGRARKEAHSLSHLPIFAPVVPARRVVVEARHRSKVAAADPLSVSASSMLEVSSLHRVGPMWHISHSVDASARGAGGSLRGCLFEFFVIF
jgi:hypothetical protein